MALPPTYSTPRAERAAATRMQAWIRGRRVRQQLPTTVSAPTTSHRRGAPQPPQEEAAPDGRSATGTGAPPVEYHPLPSQILEEAARRRTTGMTETDDSSSSTCGRSEADEAEMLQLLQDAAEIEETYRRDHEHDAVSMEAMVAWMPAPDAMNGDGPWMAWDPVRSASSPQGWLEEWWDLAGALAVAMPRDEHFLWAVPRAALRTLLTFVPRSQAEQLERFVARQHSVRLVALASDANGSGGRPSRE